MFNKSHTLYESENSDKTKMMFGTKIVSYTGRSCIRLPTVFGRTLRILCQSAFKNAKSFPCANFIKHKCSF